MGGVLWLRIVGRAFASQCIVCWISVRRRRCERALRAYRLGEEDAVDVRDADG